jgi:hypothetical protein
MPIENVPGTKGANMPRHGKRITLDTFLGRAGWLIVVTCALSLSFWSLYWVGRKFGLPPILAGMVSACLDGAALVCAQLALTYARSHDSGLTPRIGVFVMAGASSWLNAQHAIIAGYPPAARILFGLPPLVAVFVFEIQTRYQRRAALKRAGRVPAALPAIGRTAWVLFPIRSLRVIRSIVKFRLTTLENQAGMSQFRRSLPEVSETVSETSIQIETRQVRTWAQIHGFNVGDRGPVPAEVTEAYRLAITSASNGNGNGHAAEVTKQIVQGSDPE